MRRIQPADVIAVAVDGVHLPPVGLVSDCDDDSLILDLYSWLACTFDAGQMLIRRRDVRATLWATPMLDDDLHVGVIEYDMTPLANFQQHWRIR